MKLISCPEEYKLHPTEISCFMGGGMGNIAWQEAFINQLRKYDLPQLIIFNPYNPKIEDCRKQIDWEFRYLNSFKTNRHIFSMFFDKFTRQAVSMYELGRMTVLSQKIQAEIQIREVCERFEISSGFPLVISVHKDSPVKDDVLIQCELAGIQAEIRTPEEHADKVAEEYFNLKEK